MKAFLNTISILIFSVSVVGQFKIDYKISEESKETVFTELVTATITLENGNILVVKNTNRAFASKQTWAVYDKNLSLILDFEIKDKYIHKLYKNDTGIYAFYSILSDFEKQGMYIGKVNENDFILESGNQIHFYDKSKESDFRIKESADKSKILISESFRNSVFAESTYKMSILDSHFNILWDKQFGLKDISIPKEHFYTATESVGNNGAVYMSGRKYLSKKHSKGKSAFNGFSVKRIFKEEKVNFYDLPFKESIMYGLGGKRRLIQNNNDDNLKLIVLQMKSNGKAFYHFEVVELTEQLGLVNRSIIEPSKNDFLGLTEKQRKKKDWVEDSQKDALMKIVKVLPNDDLILITEKGSASNVSNSKNVGLVVTDARLSSIFVYKLNKNNELNWAREVSKNQVGADHNVGFVWKGDEKNQYFIFNDSEKNYLNKENNTPKYNANFLSSNILKGVKINNETGNLAESIIFKLDEVNMWAYLSNGYGAKNYIDISQENLILLGNKNNKFSLIRLDIKP